ncbi:ligand-binding protein SH3 [Brachyspira pilosicoli]|uniref:ligand-binding protein SH3 n=1 Tax=Brachyspira pilosicoli TaxID=52584 RepID=UPI0012F4BAC7|nr:ligand-binding protein SH3 [Brachyspira pilosicoli]
MPNELKKKEPIQKIKNITWSFTAPLEIGNEIKNYACKYNMSLGEYIEAIHKRYIESIQKK